MVETRLKDSKAESGCIPSVQAVFRDPGTWLEIRQQSGRWQMVIQTRSNDKPCCQSLPDQILMATRRSREVEEFDSGSGETRSCLTGGIQGLHPEATTARGHSLVRQNVFFRLPILGGRLKHGPAWWALDLSI
jgi:hypothetical protein